MTPVVTDVVKPEAVPLPLGVRRALSAREQQVLSLFAAGHTVTEIGGLLLLSPKTISTYKDRIKSKLAIGTNVEWMNLLKAAVPAAA